MLKYAEGQKKFAFNDPMPGMLSYEAAKKLIATADLLGCSIDYLLGRTDVKGVAAAPAAAPEKCVKVDTWHTGNPPAPGAYIAYGLWGGEEACYMATWNDDGWDMDTVYLGSVSAWAYPPDRAVPVSEAPAAEPEKCVMVDTWHTGTPPEPGTYIGLIRYTATGSLVPDEVEREDGQWLLCGLPIDDADFTVVCWTEYPELPKSPLNSACITGMSPSGHCGSAAYCDNDATCCLQCDEDCNIRCGWIGSKEDT